MGYAARESRFFWTWMAQQRWPSRLKYACLIWWYPPLKRKVVGRCFWSWLMRGKTHA